MSVKVFGASGFIGANLVKYLSKNYKVQSISLRENRAFKEEPDAKIFINLVGKAHDHKKLAVEDDFYYVNYELTKQIFKEFMDSSAQILIHVSSIAAIEEFESKEPLVEDGNINPVSWYGKSKRLAEEFLINQELPVNKKIIIIRPPMVHGPGDKGNLGLLYKFISKGLPYPLSGFKNYRSFISIENFCFFIEKLIEKSSNINSGIFHIADDETVSTTDIIRIIEKVSDKKSFNFSFPKTLITLLAKFGDVIPFPINSVKLKKLTSDLVVSNNKIKQTLGIKSLPITAKKGLETTIRSFVTSDNHNQ
ncbi:MAG: NAD-dependent epimerase/dehydratase family protein [Sphingobacterium sp.]